MKFLENIVELFNWLWIFLSPTVIFGFIGYAIHHSNPGGIGMGAFAGLSFLGIALGVFFAERIRKSIGCSIFLTKNYWSASSTEDDPPSEDHN